ncbi:MAG: translocation/assembly module TamB domain-containing protein, partial [Boseongicola sp.]|nr:translocation/assembly module TamB domain-containing protein [Boseongicola sp.]
NGTAILVEEGSLTTNMVALSVEGELGPVDSQVALSATLSNVGVFAPGLNGPLTASGTIRQTDSAMLGVNIEAVGPGGSTARIQGSTASDFSNVNLDVRGSAPLGLTNRFILPRSLSGTANFDLRVDGPPRLASVSGRVEANGARFVDPDLAISLDDLSLTADIAQGAANVAASGNFGGGGRVEMSGRVGLIGSLDSDIAIALRSLTLTDPRLYQTTLNGNLSVVGPLSGGARISGRIDLGETNIRIPSTGLGGAGEIPDVIHINEPPPVRGTRRRAGLLDASQNGKASSGRSAYPLDIFVSTPNQIFVRGRGLDSEFGGSLRITGTTANVVPIGAFNLIRGRLDILGRRLDIEDATISLQGSFTPVIRIVATTAADDVTVRVVVSGPATNPDIGFTSEPELPEEEVLARLLFGRELQTLSPFQAAQLALAVRTLAGRGGEGVVGEVRRKTGLADLGVTSDGNGGTAVRAGAYLNENIYTDITVGSDGESELNLNLDLTPSVRLKGSASNSGETSIGIFYEKDY